ncbi:MAG TPA: hypothetical protein VGC84_07835 [Ilumatobacteraceae bacterium]|jgi:acyl-CoA synthetase (AMP-forming)/AMP-acid ligase II
MKSGDASRSTSGSSKGRRWRACFGAIDESALVLNVRDTLAAFKAPKRLFVVDTVGRAANGKLDYKTLKIRAARLVELSTER